MRCCLLTKKKIEQHRGPAHRGVEYWCGVVYWLYVHPPQNPGSEFRVYGLGFFFWLYECPAQYPGSRFDVFLVRLLCVYCVFIVCLLCACLLCAYCVFLVYILLNTPERVPFAVLCMSVQSHA